MARRTVGRRFGAQAMVTQRSSRGSIRAKLARRFAAIAIGAALAAYSLGFAVTSVWSGSVERDLARGLSSASNGENPRASASAFLSQLLDAYLLERVADVQGWASAPPVLHAAQQANASHDVQGLPNPTAETLENESGTGGSLGRFPLPMAICGPRSRARRISTGYGSPIATDSKSWPRARGPTPSTPARTGGSAPGAMERPSRG